jgi:hypothetical protein
MSADGAAASVRGFVGTFVGAVVLMAASLLYYMPAAKSSKWLSSQATAYNEVWPQGWSFFSNDPGLWTVLAYATDSAGHLTSEVIEPMMSRGNLWGLSRLSAVQYSEAVQLASSVSAGDWRTCGVPISSGCIEDALTTRITNNLVPALICGSIFLVEVPPGGSSVGVSAYGGVKVHVVRAQIQCPS